MTAVQKELATLEKKMMENPTSDDIKHMERIKAMATTPEDQAAIEDFVARQLGMIEQDVEEMEQEALRLQMGEVLEIVNLSYIAKKYFGRTQSWLSQRINGCIVNGKKASFNTNEIQTLNQALSDIAHIIGSHPVRI